MTALHSVCAASCVLSFCPWKQHEEEEMLLLVEVITCLERLMQFLYQHSFLIVIFPLMFLSNDAYNGSR